MIQAAKLWQPAANKMRSSPLLLNARSILTIDQNQSLVCIDCTDLHLVAMAAQKLLLDEAFSRKLTTTSNRNESKENEQIPSV